MMDYYKNIMRFIWVCQLFVLFYALRNDHVYDIVNISNVKRQIERFIHYMTNIGEEYSDKTLNDFLAVVIWKGSYMYTCIQYRCGKLYSTFPFIHRFVDALRNVTKKPHSEEYPWATITQLLQDPYGKLTTMDVKFSLTDFEWKDKTMDENLRQLHEMCITLLETRANVVECLLMYSSNEDFILSQVVNRKNMHEEYTPDSYSKTKESDIRFLTVNYLHDELVEQEELVICAPYYRNGNQILSGAFVGKLLTSQGYIGPFDNTYKVIIIDKQVKVIDFSYSQYIELDEVDTVSGYRIVGEPEPITETVHNGGDDGDDGTDGDEDSDVDSDNSGDTERSAHSEDENT